MEVQYGLAYKEKGFLQGVGGRRKNPPQK